MIIVPQSIYTESLPSPVPKVFISEAVTDPSGNRRRSFIDIPDLKGDISQFRQYLGDYGIPITLTDEVEIAGTNPFCGFGGPLARSYTIKGIQRYSESNLTIPNRFAIQPMEGWDANLDGSPSEAVKERWRSFGRSGAGLIWGCEAVAVRHDGRANPNQLMLNDATSEDFVKLRQEIINEHRRFFPGMPRPIIGLQLTHSGRFASPNEHNSKEPRILYNHSLLSNDLSNNGHYMSDADIRELIKDFIHAAVLAQKAGFDFVDIKHCHGYLGHEFLSAVDRQGSEFGGSFENRTRFLREVVEGIRREAPGLHIGVRLSAYDFVSYLKNEDGFGKPTPFTGERYSHAFGGDGTGQGIDLEEPIRFLNLLEHLGIQMVNVTAGSPYYNSHIQRPTHIPPTDAYYTPVDPLATMALQFEVTAALKKYKPNMFFVGSGYTYAQEFFDRVAEANVENEKVDSVGYGRMVIPYPTAAADILNGNFMEKIDPASLVSAEEKAFYNSSRSVCQLIGFCTTGPRNGYASDCPIKKGFKDRAGFETFRALSRAGKIMKPRK